MSMIKWISVFLAMLFSTAPLLAQINRGAIRGSVTDPTGAAVPAVEVQARNVGTSISTTTTTSAEGEFSLRSVLPGVYELSVGAPGFKTAVVERAIFWTGKGVVSERTTDISFLPSGSAEAWGSPLDGPCT